MFQKFTHLAGYTLGATDGEIGAVRDMLFEDENWLVRYLVIDTGKWLPGRKVLIPASALGQAIAGQETFPVARTRDEVKHAPGLEEDQPVSRQFEMALHDYYQWLPYWGYEGVSGAQPLLAPVTFPPPEGQAAEAGERGDPHLRSAREILHYHAGVGEEDVGRVADLVVSTQEWRVALVVVETGHWFPGRRLGVPVEHVRELRLAGEMLEVACSREVLKHAPEIGEAAEVDDRIMESIRRYYEEGSA